MDADKQYDTPSELGNILYAPDNANAPHASRPRTV